MSLAWLQACGFFHSTCFYFKLAVAERIDYQQAAGRAEEHLPRLHTLLSIRMRYAAAASESLIKLVPSCLRC